MPTFGDLTFGDSRFFTTPPPPHSPQIDPAPNRNYLGHYNIIMKSYMKYLVWKFAVIIEMPEIIFVSD